MSSQSVSPKINTSRKLELKNYAWMHQANDVQNNDPCAGQIVNTCSIRTTQKLLDGAIASARQNIASTNTRASNLSYLHWIWQLAGLYHLTHFSPQLLEEAAQRFAAVGHTNLAQWARQKAREERGHDQLALLDIQSLGYSAEAVVKVLVPPTAAALVDYFTRSVQTQYPINCVGYSYTMERLAMGIGETYIQAIEALLPSSVQATRCLRVHSCVGSDVEHVQETIAIVAGLACEERVYIAIACYETALLYFRSAKEISISEEELQDVLKPFKLHSR